MAFKKFAYCAAVEEYPAQSLVEYAQEAEKYGVDEVWISDHFHPWVHSNSHCSNAWIVLTEIAALTKRVCVGTTVTAPILRYHPAIVAQSFATLENLHPKRVFLGVGLGEAINELPLGYSWPSTAERAERLKEAIEVIRKLWSEDYVNYKGKYFRLRKANIFDKPKTKIPILIATAGPKIAKLAGRISDGVITVPMDAERLSLLLKAFDDEVRDAGKDPAQIDKALLVHVSFDQDREKAINAILPWRATLLPFVFEYGIYDPRYIERLGEFVGIEAVEKGFVIATTEEDIIRKCEQFFRLGFNKIGFAPSGNPSLFFKVLGEKVIPYFKHEK
jgi:G6PDH family F420-dependent oxidoreductase